MGKTHNKLTARQQQLLELVREKNGALVKDVMHITQNDQSAARSALDALIRKGYVWKKPVKIRIETPFLLGSGNTHLQKFAKYFPVDPPPEAG